MNRQLLGTLLISILLILSATGILLYLENFEKSIASLHTFFALLFIIAMVFHLLNNKLPLQHYLLGKRQQRFKKYQAPLVFILVGLIACGVYFDLPLLNRLYNYGNELRNKKLGKTEESFDYQIVTLEEALGKQNIRVELKKGEAFQYPLFAIWAEDTLGNYLETLYISRVIASSTYDYGKEVDGTWEAAIVRRPEALPYWSHKRGVKATDGLFIPLKSAPDIDGVSGATPTSNFIIKSKSDFKNKENCVVLIELNQSYDWNEYYTKDKFPQDEIYSGSGRVGQPSLVYAASVFSEDLKSKKHKIMEISGHGHHSGKNGNLYTDVTNITTARQIAERIILTLE